MSDEEFSESGAPLYRYNDVTPREFKPAFSDGENIEAISDHIEKYIGPVETVFHELVSDLVHIDVHFVKPTTHFPFQCLITSGMSDLPMNTPAHLTEANKYAELCVLLPPDWPLDEDSFKEERNYWPVRWLKVMARFPHEFQTWFSNGHTLPNGENAEPFAENTQLGCMLLLPSLSLPNEFFSLKINDEKTIQFYCLYPLYKEEMDFKMKNGVDVLIDKFEKFNIRDVIDVKRRNVCKKKGLFGLW